MNDNEILDLLQGKWEGLVNRNDTYLTITGSKLETEIEDEPVDGVIFLSWDARLKVRRIRVESVYWLTSAIITDVTMKEFTVYSFGDPFNDGSFPEDDSGTVPLSEGTRCTFHRLD